MRRHASALANDVQQLSDMPLVVAVNRDELRTPALDPRRAAPLGSVCRHAGAVRPSTAVGFS